MRVVVCEYELVDDVDKWKIILTGTYPYSHPHPFTHLDPHPHPHPFTHLDPHSHSHPHPEILFFKRNVFLYLILAASNRDR